MKFKDIFIAGIIVFGSFFIMINWFGPKGFLLWFMVALAICAAGG